MPNARTRINALRTELLVASYLGLIGGRCVGGLRLFLQSRHCEVVLKVGAGRKGEEGGEGPRLELCERSRATKGLRKKTGGGGGSADDPKRGVVVDVRRVRIRVL